MVRKAQVERIKRAEQEIDAAYKSRDIKAAKRATAVLYAAVRNSSSEEIKKADPLI